jgi:hypothetical protein
MVKKVKDGDKNSLDLNDDVSSHWYFWLSWFNLVGSRRRMTATTNCLPFLLVVASCSCSIALCWFMWTGWPLVTHVTTTQTYRLSTHYSYTAMNMSSVWYALVLTFRAYHSSWDGARLHVETIMFIWLPYSSMYSSTNSPFVQYIKKGPLLTSL